MSAVRETRIAPFVQAAICPSSDRIAFPFWLGYSALTLFGDIPCPARGPRRRPGDRCQTKGAVLPKGATLPRLSGSGRRLPESRARRGDCSAQGAAMPAASDSLLVLGECTSGQTAAARQIGAARSTRKRRRAASVARRQSTRHRVGRESDAGLGFSPPAGVCPTPQVAEADVVRRNGSRRGTSSPPSCGSRPEARRSPTGTRGSSTSRTNCPRRPAARCGGPSSDAVVAPGYLADGRIAAASSRSPAARRLKSTVIAWPLARNPEKALPAALPRRLTLPTRAMIRLA